MRRGIASSVIVSFGQDQWVPTGCKSQSWAPRHPHGTSQAGNLPPVTCWLKDFVDDCIYPGPTIPWTVRARICHLGSRSFLSLSVFRLVPGQFLQGMCHCLQKKGHSTQVIRIKPGTLSKVYLVLTANKTSKTFHEIKIQI